MIFKKKQLSTVASETVCESVAHMSCMSTTEWVAHISCII